MWNDRWVKVWFLQEQLEEDQFDPTHLKTFKNCVHIEVELQKFLQYIYDSCVVFLASW